VANEVATEFIVGPSKCMRCPDVLQKGCRANVVATINGIIFLSLFSVPYFSPRMGCPRVMKFYMGFLVTQKIRFMVNKFFWGTFRFVYQQKEEVCPGALQKGCRANVVATINAIIFLSLSSPSLTFLPEGVVLGS
jgi:hypothetical protein